MVVFRFNWVAFNLPEIPMIDDASFTGHAIGTETIFMPLQIRDKKSVVGSGLHRCNGLSLF